MYDIRHLESEWKKYRKKRLKAWYIAFFILILLSSIAIFFLNSEKIDVSTLKGYFQGSKESLTFQEKSNNGSLPEEQNKNSYLLVDSALERLEVEDSVIEMVDSTAKSSSDIVVDVPILDDSKVSMDREVLGSREKVHLEIIESTSVTAYQDVENRFNQSKDINDALFLAQSYYNNGNYKKAEYWALQTNKLDATLEESLLLFVKSKVKLGRKNEAIAILSSYLKKSNSQDAKKLLYKIENDKL